MLPRVCLPSPRGDDRARSDPFRPNAMISSSLPSAPSLAACLCPCAPSPIQSHRTNETNPSLRASLRIASSVRGVLSSDRAGGPWTKPRDQRLREVAISCASLWIAPFSAHPGCRVSHPSGARDHVLRDLARRDLFERFQEPLSSGARLL